MATLSKKEQNPFAAFLTNCMEIREIEFYVQILSMMLYNQWQWNETHETDVFWHKNRQLPSHFIYIVFHYVS